MIEQFQIARYCRISVYEEPDWENTSIETRKSIIKEYVTALFSA